MYTAAKQSAYRRRAKGGNRQNNREACFNAAPFYFPPGGNTTTHKQKSKEKGNHHSHTIHLVQVGVLFAVVKKWMSGSWCKQQPHTEAATSFSAAHWQQSTTNNSYELVCLTTDNPFTPRTDHRFLLQYLDLPSKADIFPILYYLVQVAWWDPYNLHDQDHVSWLDLYYVDLAHLTTAGRWGTINRLLSRSWSAQGANPFILPVYK